MSGYYDEEFGYWVPYTQEEDFPQFESPVSPQSSSSFGSPWQTVSSNSNRMERYPSNSSGSSYYSYDSSQQAYNTGASSPGSVYLPGIEVINGGVVGNSNRAGTSSRSNARGANTSWVCAHPGCEHIAKRQFDLDRHIKNKHGLGTERFDCTGKNCHRVGENGFKRKDHLREHLRKVHMKTEEYPKTGGRRKDSSSSR